MNLSQRTRARLAKPIRRPVRLGIEHLECRDVPSAVAAAFDARSIAVGFRTNYPADPVVPRAVAVAPGQTIDQALALWRQDPAALVRALERATPFLQFRLDRVLVAADLATLEGRARAAGFSPAAVASLYLDVVTRVAPAHSG